MAKSSTVEPVDIKSEVLKKLPADVKTGPYWSGEAITKLRYELAQWLPELWRMETAGRKIIDEIFEDYDRTKSAAMWAEMEAIGRAAKTLEGSEGVAGELKDAVDKHKELVSRKAAIDVALSKVESDLERLRERNRCIVEADRKLKEARKHTVFEKLAKSLS